MAGTAGNMLVNRRHFTARVHNTNGKSVSSKPWTVLQVAKKGPQDGDNYCLGTLLVWFRVSVAFMKFYKLTGMGTLHPFHDEQLRCNLNADFRLMKTSPLRCLECLHDQTTFIHFIQAYNEEPLFIGRCTYLWLTY
jgi:hypothetical protein